MTTATPTRSDQLEDLLSDPAKLTPAAFKDAVTGYIDAAMDDSVKAQVKEQVTATVADLLKVDTKTAKTLDLGPDRGPQAPRAGAAHNRRAPGAALDGHYDDTGDFFQAIWGNNGALTNAADLNQKAAGALRIQNSFGSLVPDAGGFLIPEVMRAELLRVSLESSIVRPRARVIPMGSARLPIPTIDSTSNASSVFGGVTAYWQEEGAAATESQASFGRVVLDAKKLVGYAEFPNELMADAVAIGSLFDQTFPEALAWFEDVAFIAGSGAGEPLGFTKSNALVTVTKESGQASATVLWQNIVKLYARMLPSSLGKAVWIVNQETFTELATMALSVGTGGSAIWLTNGADGAPTSLLGRPIIVSEKVPALGSANDICFVDLSYYLIGDRQMLTAAQSTDFKFSSDKAAFKVIERVDGQPWLGTAITPRNGTNTLSPYVALGAR